MTPAQLATLKAAIDADPTLSAQGMDGDGLNFVADAMNAVLVPAFTVWRSSVPIDDIMRNGMDWARVDNLSVGKARIWEWMSRLGSFNPSKTNIRAGIDAAWVGTAADLAVRAVIYTHCKRDAKRAEKLFSTGTGTVADPATMTFEGIITPGDVDTARRS